MTVRSLLVAVLCVLLPNFAGAEPTAAPTTAVELADPLPALSDDGTGGVTINSTNLESFRSVIVPELLPLFREGQLEIDAGHMKTDLSIGSNWALEPTAGATMLLSAGGSRAGVKFVDGFLFGDSKSINEENDPKVKAQKILWNGLGVWASERILGTGFEFSWIKDGKPFRTLKGEFSRIFPVTLGDAKQAAQLFRELIRFTSPAVLADLSWLTFQFLGNDEDILWVFSPANKKVRQLTGTNRSDPLLRSSVTPEDVLVWSGKVELVDVRVEREMNALIPRLRQEIPSTLTDKGCSALDRAAAVAGRMTSRWNFDANRYAHGGPWVPVSSVLSPAKLWRVEVNSQDPFTAYGRQVLYVEQDSMLPMYKFVYNSSGRLWKSVIGAYGYLSGANAAPRRPYPAYTIVIDHLKGETYILDFSRVLRCADPVPSLDLGDFDPKRFGELSKPSGLPAIPTPQVPTEETDEL